MVVVGKLMVLVKSSFHFYIAPFKVLFLSGINTSKHFLKLFLLIYCTALEMHLSDLKAKHTLLTQEKSKMEEDFCIQRAKLKELYLQKEGVVSYR